jgi:uncharacterized protein YndB with AHSA1/START domain
MVEQKKSTLEVTLPSDREIAMTRRFDARREAVFDALTKPELLKRWFGPQGWSLTGCDVDLRVGGAWRFTLRRADGTDFAMYGVYREIAPPERLVYTEAYEGDDFFGELLVTVELVEDGDQTTLTSTALHKSKEVRDANASMEQGVSESLDKLADLLREMS